MATSGVLATTRWQDIQGENNWKGLLDPLHPDLRDAGIRYGEFIEAVYDAIDMDDKSMYVYYSLFGKSKLFESVGVHQKYTITSYLYSTLLVDGWGKLFGYKNGASTVWLGFIAVSNDEETKRLGRRDVAIIFRGTKAKNEEWINSNFGMTDFKELGPSPYPKVAGGFLSMYVASDPSKPFGNLSVRQQVFKELNRLIQVEHKDEDMSITFLGHSMGAGIAPIAAADFGFNMQRVDGGRTVMVSAFVFGAPKSGDRVFKERAEKSCKVIRIVDTGDFVTLVPPVSVVPPGVYEHVGVVWRVNWADSPYVQNLGVASMRCHNLELYIHCIAGHKKVPLRLARAVKPVQLFRSASVQEGEVPETEIPEELKKLFEDDMGTLHAYVAEQDAIIKASRLLHDGQQEEDGLRSVKRARLYQTTTPSAVAKTSTSTFEMVVERDPALMNKSDDIVIKELGVPVSWWVHGFRNMRLIDGKWLPRQEWPLEYIPSEDNPEFNYES